MSIYNQLNLVHLNSDVLCVVAGVTTGPDPTQHDLLSFCILPLDSSLKASRVALPFYLMLKPRFPENIENLPRKIPHKLGHYLTFGMDYFEAARLFDDWYDKLGLKPGKKIVPLGYKYSALHPFLVDFLGPQNVECCFSTKVRDIESAALLFNDRAAFKAEKIPIPKTIFSYMQKQLNLPPCASVDALEIAKSIAEIYRKFMGFFG